MVGSTRSKLYFECTTTGTAVELALWGFTFIWRLH